jgi:hypothetical protein
MGCKGRKHSPLFLCLTKFGEDYLSTQHSLEYTEGGAEAIFGVVLALLTAGAGAAVSGSAAAARIARYGEKLKPILERLSKLLKRRRAKKGVKTERDTKSGDKPETNKKITSKKIVFKRHNRRHDICKTKGKDRTKKENTMIDPDYAEAINQDLSLLKDGKYIRDGENFIVGERIYGAHIENGMGTVYPKSGPGLVQMDRAQHSFIKMLNNKGEAEAIYWADKQQLSQKKLDEVLKLWKKC